ncbi:MAG: hypothetical protein R2688_05945 [Fimbriimonadaceae bacterium]
MAIVAWMVWGKRVSAIGAIEAKLEERTQRRDEAREADLGFGDGK